MVSQEMFGVPYSTIGFSGARHRQISDEVYRRMEMDNGTQYGEYRAPGGENYREILLKLPDDKQRFWAKNGQGVERIFNNPDEASRFAGSSGDARAMDSQTVDRMRNEYHSSHWRDDSNVLAHMRVQDRKGPNGEKILHVEEIQSDWHQAGRKKGYKPDDYVEQSNALDREFNDLGKRRTQLLKQAELIPTDGAEFTNLIDEANSITPKLMQLQEQRDKMRDVINYAVPDAPFKKNWHELAMKRLLNYAADNGYDSIAITPGAEQAKRYDLSKQISRVVYSPDTEMLNAFDHNNKSVVMHSGVKPDQVADYIGKEPAQRLFDEQNTKLNFKGGKDVPYQEIAGIDLQVGGEGMIGFYDQILPSYLNTFGKPYGSQVSTINMTSSRGAPQIDEIQRMAGINQDQWRAMTGDERVRLSQEMQAKANAGGMPLHNFPITPEMRESIKQKGLPLYQQVGIPTAGAGAASQMPEQEEPQYGPGGAISKMALKAAPQVVKPSTLTELKKVVQQEKGGYGARRLERAADEVPNLEKLYKEQALKEAFLGDNAKALMTMNPADFEKYAAKLLPRNVSVPGVMGDKMRQSTEDYVKYLRELPEGFNEAPYLLINKEEFGLPLIPYVTGHEGRHRNRALTTQGEKSNLVRFVPSFELREPLPRRSQEEYIEGLKQELQMTGNQVMPEKYWDDSLPKNLLIQRPPIQLPDIYAKGGAVKPKVKDSKSGKVRMTENRDTMFMELSNKKLKRK
jgi:hypothetical protein